MVQTSLDNISLISRHGSRWTAKQKRGYMRCRAGVERCDVVGDKLFFLTLTSARDGGLRTINRDFGLLVKRVRRELGFRFDYFKIITCEGYGVIHALFRCRKTDFCWSYDAVHAYFSCLWMELHGAFVVWVTACYKVAGTFQRLVRYLVSQYVVAQSFLHLGYSSDWCFRGFVRRFKELIRELGFKNGLVAWRNVLQNVGFEWKKGYRQGSL